MPGNHDVTMSLGEELDTLSGADSPLASARTRAAAARRGGFALPLQHEAAVVHTETGGEIIIAGRCYHEARVDVVGVSFTP